MIQVKWFNYELDTWIVDYINDNCVISHNELSATKYNFYLLRSSSTSVSKELTKLMFSILNSKNFEIINLGVNCDNKTLMGSFNVQKY